MGTLDLLKSVTRDALVKPTAAALKAAPISTVNILGSLGSMIAKPVLDATVKEPDDFHKAIRNENQRRNYLSFQLRQQERLKRTMELNSMQLATLDPHTYNEVLAGRRLAQGTQVFGGVPRTDLMDMLTEQMATGRLAPPPTAEDQISSMM